MKLRVASRGLEPRLELWQKATCASANPSAACSMHDRAARYPLVATLNPLQWNIIDNVCEWSSMRNKLQDMFEL